MRKALTVLCALITAALFPIAELISRGLPADTGSYVEQKYAGWNGVLQAWVCCAWNPGGSFISWLNGCAADFERAHNGVYIEFTPVDETSMREMMEGKLRRPELIFFSPGVLTDSDGLNALDYPGRLRRDLRLDNHALPVAMGGYIWVYNTALADGAPARNEALPITSLTDGGGRSFAPALIALLSDPLEDEAREIPLPDAGIDLGLPANAQPNEAAGNSTMLQAEDALEQFIRGGLPRLAVTQAELSRLNRLRESGRGPDWICAASGQFAWADQLLLLGSVHPDGTATAEREALAGEFAASLFTEKAQQALAKIGAFSVTDEAIHSATSVYAQMDGLLASRPLVTPEFFHAYSCDGADTVRAYCEGQCSEEEAFTRLGLDLSLPNHPN